MQRFVKDCNVWHYKRNYKNTCKSTRKTNVRYLLVLVRYTLIYIVYHSWFGFVKRFAKAGIPLSVTSPSPSSIWDWVHFAARMSRTIEIQLYFKKKNIYISIILHNVVIVGDGTKISHMKRKHFMTRCRVFILMFVISFILFYCLLLCICLLIYLLL